MRAAAKRKRAQLIKMPSPSKEKKGVHPCSPSYTPRHASLTELQLFDTNRTGTLDENEIAWKDVPRGCWQWIKTLVFLKWIHDFMQRSTKSTPESQLQSLMDFCINAALISALCMTISLPSLYNTEGMPWAERHENNAGTWWSADADASTITLGFVITHAVSFASHMISVILSVLLIISLSCINDKFAYTFVTQLQRQHKHALNIIFLLTVVGVVLLCAGVVFFGWGMYGWRFTLTITGIVGLPILSIGLPYYYKTVKVLYSVPNEAFKGAKERQKNVSNLTSDEICRYLQKVHSTTEPNKFGDDFHRVLEKFKEEAIDGDVLEEAVTVEFLRTECGMKLGYAIKLCREIHYRKASGIVDANKNTADDDREELRESEAAAVPETNT